MLFQVKLADGDVFSELITASKSSQFILQKGGLWPGVGGRGRMLAEGHA
jgi:hypothetical protein